jgi:hypothetical protein
LPECRLAWAISIAAPWPTMGTNVSTIAAAPPCGGSAGAARPHRPRVDDSHECGTKPTDIEAITGSLEVRPSPGPVRRLFAGAVQAPSGWPSGITVQPIRLSPLATHTADAQDPAMLYCWPPRGGGLSPWL